jgi:hypothetical protein
VLFVALLSDRRRRPLSDATTLLNFPQAGLKFAPMRLKVANGFERTELPMSCWVVPTLAAELWGVPLDHVLGQVQSGAVPSKVDYGFTLIDVAPGCDYIASPPAPVVPPPPTFVSVDPAETALSASIQASLSDEEFQALNVEEPALPQMAEPSADELLALTALPSAEVTTTTVTAAPRRRRAFAERLRAPAPVSTPVTIPQESADEHEDGPDPNFGEADDGKPLDWRAARSRVALTRRRPPPLRVN